LWEAFQRDYGAEGDPGILVAKGSTLDFNLDRNADGKLKLQSWVDAGMSETLLQLRLSAAVSFVPISKTSSPARSSRLVPTRTPSVLTTRPVSPLVSVILPAAVPTR
jgi:hypothetical protein